MMLQNNIYFSGQIFDIHPCSASRDGALSSWSTAVPYGANYSYKCTVLSTLQAAWKFTFYLHDAVYLYLRTLNQTLTDGYVDYRDGRLILKRTIGQRFAGRFATTVYYDTVSFASLCQSINQFFNYRNVKTHFHVRKTQSSH